MTALRVVAIVLVGCAVGLLGAFVQAVRWTPSTPWGQWSVPWGLALALLALILVIRGAVWWTQARWAGWLLFGGWLVASAAMAFESPSGDVALGPGTRPLVYLISAGVLGAFAATLPAPSRSRVAL